MPTYAELDDEACWRAQAVPPALLWLAEQLRAHYGQSANEIGSPGDNRHLRGAHRSRRWIRESAYCTNRTYTVSHADDKLGDEDWYAGIDIDPGDLAKLTTMCRRLDAAVRAGLFPEVAEWFGNLGGDQVVDGWNNIARRPASSDSSHLGHLHLTILRRFANSMALMQRLLATLIGDDMNLTDVITLPPASLYPELGTQRTVTVAQALAWTTARALRIELEQRASAAREAASLAAINALAAAVNAGGGSIDTAAVLARIDERSAEDLARDLAAAARIEELEAQLAAVPKAAADLVHEDLAD